MLESSTETEKKLSDYMLQGVKQTDRLEADYIEAGPVRYKACALGAAYYARESEMLWEFGCDVSGVEIYECFPELHEDSPETGLDLLNYRSTDLGEFITVLNDKLHWRRDRIARYIKKLGY
jgi:hypothetical protein